MDFLTWVRNQWDRVGAWIAIVFGGVALLAGWLGASRSSLTTEQIPYVLSGGLGGLFLLGLGAMLWLSADLRDEWRKLDEIARRDADEVPEGREASDGVPADPSNEREGRSRPLRAS